jgi:hypothetical protein
MSKAIGISVGPSNAVKFLFAVGVLGQAVAWSLFYRMVIKLNQVVPPAKRIRLDELRYPYFSAIKRLHEEWFPTSTSRTVCLVLMVVSTSLVAIAIILGIRPVG